MLESAGGLLPVLVEATWKGSVLLMVLLVLARLMRGAPAATRHLLWSAGVVGLVALPLLGAAVPWRLEVLPTARTLAAPGSHGGEESPREAASPAVARTGSREAVSAQLPGTDAVHILPSDARAAATSAPDARGMWTTARGAGDEALAGDARTAIASALPGWAATLALVWGLGAAVLALRLVAGWALMRRIVRRATPLTDDRWAGELLRGSERVGLARPVRLLRSERVPVAFTTGVLRPVVVLPPECGTWSAARRRAVLMHELAHVRRGDVVMHLVGRAACAIHWFNPLAWLASKRLRAESERACDDMVLTLGTRASEYAGHLLDLVRSAGRLRAPAVVVPMAQESEFEGRLLAILEPGLRRHRPSRLTAAAIVVAVALSAVPLAAMAPRPSRSAEPAGIPGAGPGAATEAAVEAGINADAEAGAGTAAPDPAAAATDSDVVADALEAGTTTGAPGAASPADASEAAAPVISVVPAGSPPMTLEVENPRFGRYEQRPGASAALLGLRRALDDPDAGVRVIAVRALAEHQDTAAVVALMRALVEDDDVEVRETAAWALGQIESLRAVPALARAVTEDAAAGVRTRAAWALGQIEAPPAVPALVRALDDDVAEVRQQAAWALGQIEDGSAVSGLVGALDDADADVRRQAVWALGEIEDPRAVDGLMPLVADPSAEVRSLVVWALAEIADPRAAPALGRALQDSVPKVRARAAAGLGDMDLQRAPEALLAAVRDPDPQVRRMVAAALADIEDPASVPALGVLLRDESPQVRRYALHALGEIGSEAAIQAMVEALSDTDAEVRREAARALGRVGGDAPEV